MKWLLGSDGDSRSASRLMAVAMLGLCRAVRIRSVTPDAACQCLFNPALIDQLVGLSAPAKLVRAAELASELSDVEEIVPARLSIVLETVEAHIQEALGELGPVDPRARMWNAFKARV